MTVDDDTAAVVPLDSASRPSTATMNVRRFTILEDDPLNLPIDFVADSFFQLDHWVRRGGTRLALREGQPTTEETS